MADAERETSLYRRTELEIRSDGIAEAESAFGKYMDHVMMNEPGTLRSEVFQTHPHAGRFVHFEEFRDRDARRASLASPARAELLNALDPLVIDGFHSQEYVGYAMAGAGRFFHDRSVFEIRVLLTARGDDEAAELREIFSQVIESGDKPDGLLHRDILIDPNDDRLFMFTERWVSQEMQQLAATTRAGHARLLELADSTVLAPFATG